jgi:predicted helicase
LWISEKLNSKVTLICVPSLSLLKQTVDVWTHQSKGALEFRCVCSDSDVYQHASEDALVASTHNLGIPVTTSAKELLPFLRKRSGQAKVIFSTYQSLGVVGKALRRARACITLGIADEAHRTAGDAESDWRLFHEDSKVPIKYRLYMTATPRVVSPTLMKRAKSERIYLYCMDNEKDFGKPFFEMTFGQAIKQRILSDYRIVIAHSYSRRSNLGFRPNSKSQLSSSCEPYLLQE